MSTRNPTKAIPVALMPGINRIKPSHDREVLKKNHVKSPDLSKMKFRIYDPRMKTMVFFASMARKKSYIKRLENPQPEALIKKGGRKTKKLRA